MKVGSPVRIDDADWRETVSPGFGAVSANPIPSSGSPPGFRFSSRAAERTAGLNAPATIPNAVTFKNSLRGKSDITTPLPEAEGHRYEITWVDPRKITTNWPSNHGPKRGA